jgi:hypothetical protein
VEADILDTQGDASEFTDANKLSEQAASEAHRIFHELTNSKEGKSN